MADLGAGDVATGVVECSICRAGCLLDSCTGAWTCDDHGYERAATDEELVSGATPAPPSERVGPDSSGGADG